jgi:hypothetical protein
MTEVFMTVDGRSRDTTLAIRDSKALFGVESTKNYLNNLATPEFVDFPFTDPSATFTDHLAAVRTVEPKLTVAPDIEKGRTIESVTKQADQLLEYADDVIVVPKTVHPTAVPDRFRVGVTAADFGSNAPWSLWAYTETDPVHILGGPPGRQLEIGKTLRVASVDTSTLNQRARYGMWDGGAVDAPDAYDYRRRLKESLDNYWRAWNR